MGRWEQLEAEQPEGMFTPEQLDRFARDGWVSSAVRHGLVLLPEQIAVTEGEYSIDGMDPDEWIMAVCGCGEDGGTLDEHAA